jgi:hypothetical protein
VFVFIRLSHQSRICGTFQEWQSEALTANGSFCHSSQKHTAIEDIGMLAGEFTAWHSISVADAGKGFAMLISASRRTDIPALYAAWFMHRIRAGYCTVPNPFNRKQITTVSLKPEDVDVIVFWTRNPRPLLPHLAELTQRGFRFYVQYTLMHNPPALDPHVPSLSASLAAFHELAARTSPDQVIWRYDPIVFTAHTDAHFHEQAYRQIAAALHGSTRRSVISIVDVYRKIQARLTTLAKQGLEVAGADGQPVPGFADLMRALAGIANEHDMELVSCAEEIDLRPYGIRPGKCIDDGYITQVFGLDVTRAKDASQRPACGCVTSRDIGMYDSCLFGCQYCYATTSFDRARRNHAQHNPASPALLGWYDADSPPAELPLP